MRSDCKRLVVLALALFLAGRAPAATRLLAVMPMGAPFRQALEGMQSDLGRNYEIRVFDVDLPGGADSLRGLLRAFSPQGLVLMDAKAVTLARELQKDSSIAALPKFLLMTLNVENAAATLRNSSGIRFEVPAYTIFTNLHAVSKRDFRRIGVLYRRKFSEFVRESARFLEKENMEIIGSCLDCDAREKIAPHNALGRLKEGMDSLAGRKVEVVWMLSDNILVNKSTLKGFWLTGFRDYRLPLVVPVPNLASLDLGLGMFAACPDYRQLGMQSAQQVIQVFESGASPSAIGLEPLIGVQTVLNLEAAAKIGWNLDEGKIQRINTVLGTGR